MHSRLRTVAVLAAAGLVVSLLTPGNANAAPTRYEAENATISQGLVESNHAGFSGTGFVNGDNVIGSYVEFTVNAANAGDATIAIRYANGTTIDRPATISVNGTAIGPATSFPGTGAWTTWVTKTVTAPVPAGSAVKIRITSTTANGNPNLDFVDFEVPPPPNFTDYQAEDALISQGVVESNHVGFTGTGFVNGDNVVGSYVEWTVNAATAGNYQLAFRYANGTTIDRPSDITVNGQPAAPALSFPGTGAWTTWVEKSITASLIVGANKVRATATTVNGNPNLDRLRAYVPADSEPPTAPTNLRLVGEPRPFDADIAWDPSSDNVGVASYKIYNGGNVMKEVGGNITSTRLINLTPLTRYVITVLAYDAAGNPSQGSNPIDFTTPESNDNEPPTVPTGLRSTTVTGNSVSLTWNASTDNIGVAGYRVFRNGIQFADVPDLVATDTGLTPDTTYSYTVLAYDANNNASAQSPPISVKTTVPGGGDPVLDRVLNSQMDLPWGIGFLPDGTALVAERDRFEIVQVTLSGQKTVRGVVTEARTTNGEGGLLGLAVSPTFNTDHYVYIYYTSDTDNRVARFRYENNTLGPREPIVTGISKNTFHNGGRIKFGPDGLLYITTGDAQSSARAQNLSSLNGKILRVNPDGTPAAGNPFATRIYSYGHRNVQGIAWDSQGRLWASEFGNSTWDELNLIRSGGNYGWPTCEGSCSDTRFIDPVRQWDVASASPSGLEIVNDWIYMAAVRGARLWVMKITGSTTDTPRAFFNGTWGRLRTVVKTPDGGLWLTSTNNDKNGGTPTVLDNRIVRLNFAGAPFLLSSTAFANNAAIPIRYTCQQDGVSGNDISPPLSWGAGAHNAKSYAITFIDTSNGGKHWVIWDIAPATLQLPEGLGLGFNVPNQSPAKQRSFGTGGKTYQFFGPCPGGSTHTYQFKLYSMNVTTLPGVDLNSTVAQVETAILANDIASTTLTGTSAAHT